MDVARATQLRLEKRRATIARRMFDRALDRCHVAEQANGVRDAELSGEGTERRLQRAPAGDVELETWYDASQTWLGLSFRGQDGSSIHYELS